MYQTSFTFRYSEWIQSSEIKNKCEWFCECPNLNNICICEKFGKKFEIESPYAALMIQTECFPPPADDDNWKPKNNVTITLTPNIKISRLRYQITGRENILRRTQLMPKENLEINYRFKYYRGGKLGTIIGFDRMKQSVANLYILIPGWSSDPGRTLKAFTDSLIEVNNSAVLIVDWLHGNQFYFDHKERIYEQAAANTVYVGCQLAAYLFHAKYDKPFQETVYHIIGFDLGSHAAHYAGVCYKQFANSAKISPKIFDRITGLDPPFYLFEHDGLIASDAKFVDIIHTNSISEKLSAIENLKLRRFGDHRQLGHVDYFVNYDAIDGKHSHDRCKTELNNVVFGCASAFSGQIFLDSILKGKGIFGKTENDNNIILGLRANHDSANGLIYINYQENICSVKNYPRMSLRTVLSEKDAVRILGPQKLLRAEAKPEVPPIETPNEINRDPKDDANCGVSTKASARVWQGSVSKEGQFPWAICLAAKTIVPYKFEYFKRDNKLYRMPKWMKPEEYSRFARVNTATGKTNIGKICVKKNVKRFCTASVIKNNWIITAAHCFGVSMNGQYLNLRAGRTSCESGPELTIKAEWIDGQKNLNIHIHENYASAWDDAYNKWTTDMSPFILTDDETYNLTKAADAAKYVDARRSELTSEPKCEETSYFDIYDERNTRYSSDIALIYVEDKYGLIMPEDNIASICIATSKSINYENFDQHFYAAGFGTKGWLEDKIPKKLAEKAEGLTWVSYWNEREIQKFGIEFAPTYADFGDIYNKLGSKTEYLYLANADMVNGSFVTSSTCGGDSGGPVFVYAKGYAILVAIVTGSDQTVS